MGQILVPDRIEEFAIATTTSLTFPSSIVSVGGQQYKNANSITVDLTTTGANGLDTGSLAADTLYYLYAVRSVGTLAITASTAAPSVGPTGFTVWTEVGRFRTFEGSATIAASSTKGLDESDTEWETFTVTGLWTANTTYIGRKKRINRDTMKMRIDVAVSAAPDAVNFGFSVPDSLSIDANKRLSSGTRAQYGMATAYDIDADDVYDMYVVHNTSTDFRVRNRRDSTSSGLMSENGPFVWGSGGGNDRLWMDVEVPIREWSGLFDY